MQQPTGYLLTLLRCWSVHTSAMHTRSVLGVGRLFCLRPSSLLCAFAMASSEACCRLELSFLPSWLCLAYLRPGSQHGLLPSPRVRLHSVASMRGHAERKLSSRTRGGVCRARASQTITTFFPTGISGWRMVCVSRACPGWSESISRPLPRFVSDVRCHDNRGKATPSCCHPVDCCHGCGRDDVR